MLKKIIIGISILLIPVLAYFGYTSIKRQQLPDFDIYKTIPTDASIIIESNDFIEKISDIRSNNKIWEEIKSFESINDLDSSMQFILNLYNKNDIFKNLFDDKQIILSIHKVGKSNPGFLFYLKLNNLRDKKFIVESVSKLLAGKENFTHRNYNNEKIYTINTGNSEVHFSFIKGIIIISHSSILVESSIRQSEVDKSLHDDNGFTRVSRTAGKNVDANIYINLSNFNNLVSGSLNGSQKRMIKESLALGNWAELDINLKEDAILLNGFTFSNDSLNNYLNIFLNQEPVNSKIKSILPSNTSVFITLGISNTQQYINDYKAFLENAGKINKYQLQVDQYKKIYGIDIEKFFKDFLDEEAGLVITDEPNFSFEESSYIVFRTQSRSNTQNKIEDIINRIAENKNISKESFISQIKIDKETSYEVFSLPLNNMFRTFFGSVFPQFKNQHITFIDNFMVIGNSKKSIHQFIHSNILHKTLENDMKFEQFTDYLSSQSNFYFYTNLFRSPEYLSGFLNPKLQKGLKENIESFKKFQAFAVQFQQNNEMIYNNLYLQYIPEIKEEAVTVWESHLDASVNFKPVLVTNHYTKENEIFVQDVNHKIYLVNQVGRILWKLQLNERINSEIFQVDYYKNGKLQLLFSTKNKIHLIDRNGNYVERYPIKLRSSSTAGIALFDYDKTLDYRIFIPCKNKNVYLYNLDGNLINGWEFGQTDTYVTSPVQHFRSGNYDYLVFADKYRTYILNRRGKERVIVKEQFSKSANNVFYLLKNNSSNKTSFVTTDTSGLVKMVYTDGTVETKQIKNYTSKHFFSFEDMNADGVKDFIFVDEKKLEVYKQNKSEIFDYKFDKKIDLSPVYYYFSYEDRKLGVVSRETNELFLFNSDGELYRGFPLKGNTQFTIGYLGNSQNQFNLIVGNQYNFLYNYSVN